MSLHDLQSEYNGLSVEEINCTSQEQALREQLLAIREHKTQTHARRMQLAAQIQQYGGQLLYPLDCTPSVPSIASSFAHMGMSPNSSSYAALYPPYQQPQSNGPVLSQPPAPKTFHSQSVRALEPGGVQVGTIRSNRTEIIEEPHAVEVGSEFHSRPVVSINRKRGGVYVLLKASPKQEGFMTSPPDSELAFGSLVDVRVSTMEPKHIELEYLGPGTTPHLPEGYVRPATPPIESPSSASSEDETERLMKSAQVLRPGDDFNIGTICHGRVIKVLPKCAFIALIDTRDDSAVEGFLGFKKIKEMAGGAYIESCEDYLQRNQRIVVKIIGWMERDGKPELEGIGHLEKVNPSHKSFGAGFGRGGEGRSGFGGGGSGSTRREFSSAYGNSRDSAAGWGTPAAPSAPAASDAWRAAAPAKQEPAVGGGWDSTPAANGNSNSGATALDAEPSAPAPGS